jgi:dipeptidyl-peptidase-3
MANQNISEQFLVPEKLNIRSLNPSKGFNTLLEKEKNYAHCMSKASWAGAPIVSKQVSPESNQIITYFITQFREIPVEDARKILLSHVSELDVNGFFNYVGMLFGNSGNYRSFGDRKFIPRIPKDVFLNIVTTLNPKFGDGQASVMVDKIYEFSDNVKILNYYPKGVTSYFSPNMTEEDVKLVNSYMTSIKMEPWNTRVVKHDSWEGTTMKPIFIIHTAAVQTGHTIKFDDGINIAVSYGDYSDELKRVNMWLTRALEFTRNETQVNMLTSYIDHFNTGKLETHKESQRYWVKDTEPPVETNMGFIENYRDPSGVRAEFQSFVSVVDGETSKKFKKMVDAAPKLIALLPWGKDFEKNEFIKPDFTSLEIITFVGSGIPAGINIPNYNDVHESHGFKNVSLGNVIRSGYSSDKEPTEFVTPKDDSIYSKFVQPSFECTVASHELLGHGSGKQFYKMKDGTFNFDRSLVNPLTKEPIESWYKEGDTYGSVFGTLSNAIEECRAECCGLFYSTNKDVQEIFKQGSDADDIMFVSWLRMIRAGLVSLEKGYDTDSKKWVQAHSQARYVIYRIMLEVKDFVTVTLNKDKNDFVISINRDTIMTQGMARLTTFMQKLQVYKSTADITNATSLFDKYSTVDDYHLGLREIMIVKSKPRPIYVQPHIYIDKYGVQLKEFDISVDGLITSMCENHTLTTDE